MKTKAKISENIAKIIPRLFDGSLTTVFGEVAQNARRAGCAKLRVVVDTTDESSTVVQFQDDGCGMNIDSILNLVTLQESGWDDEIQAQEDPAGMGFFSLFHVDKFEVVSRAEGHQTVFLRGGRESFANGDFEYGIADQHAVVPSGCGTVVSLSISKTYAAICPALTHIIAWSGIDVCELVVDGWSTEIVMSSFRSNALRQISEDHGNHVVGFRIDETNGANAVVCFNAAAHAYAVVNFYGIHLELPEEAMKYIPPGFDVKVDVTSVALFKMVLPARNAVAHTNMEQIRDWLGRVVFSAIAGSNYAHQLPFSHAVVAKSLGTPIHDSAPVLSRLSCLQTLMWVNDKSTSVMMTLKNPASWYAVRRYMTSDLCVTRGDYKGYKWYDDVTEVTSVRYVSRVGHNTSSVYAYTRGSEYTTEFEGSNAIELVDDIELHVAAVTPNGEVTTNVVNVPYAIIGNTRCDAFQEFLEVGRLLIPAKVKSYSIEKQHEIATAISQDIVRSLLYPGAEEFWLVQIHIEVMRFLIGEDAANKMCITESLRRACDDLEIEKGTRMRIDFTHPLESEITFSKGGFMKLAGALENGKVYELESGKALIQSAITKLAGIGIATKNGEGIKIGLPKGMNVDQLKAALKRARIRGDVSETLGVVTVSVAE